MHYFALRAYFGHHSRRVVTDGDQPARVQEVDHIRKKLFARLPLYVVVQSIAKGVARFVRMQWKHVPQEHRSLENDAGYGFRQEHSFVTVRRAGGGRRGAQGDGTFSPHNGNGMMRLPGDCHHYQAFPGHAYAGMTRIVWELNEVGRGDGGTLLLSGSHKAAYPAPEEIFSAGSSLWETCACPAGSVLMFTEALTHSGQPWRNPDRPRVAVFNCYNSIHAKWHNWDPPAAVLADMPPKRRSLYRPVYVAGNWIREEASAQR